VEACSLNVIWQPQPGPQTALVACNVFEVFFGGARGGGKTDGMLGEWIRHAEDYGSNAIGLMVRRERTQLIETIERSHTIYGRLEGWAWKEQDKMWRAPNGARLRFAYLERDADAEAYQGHSYTRIYIEELTNFPDPKPVMKLMATLRSGMGVPTGFRATGNPGGPGHSWVKARYIDPAPMGYEVLKDSFRNPWTGENVTRERVFIPSKLNQNRFLGSDYIANLQMSGNEALVKAWLEGDWSVIEGAFFDCWSAEKHVLRPFAVPSDWLRFRSADWGSAAPFSVGWWAVVGDTFVTPTGHTLPRGALVRYREWYGASAPNVGLRLVAEEVARGIKAKEAGDTIAYGVLDPAAFAVDGGPSIAQMMAREGVIFRPADNKRVSQKGALSGWDQMRARMKGDQDGRPMLYVFETCKDFIRTVPVLQHDPDRPEDIDTDAEDHAADEARYGCMSRPWIPRVAEPPKPKDVAGRSPAERSGAVQHVGIRDCRDEAQAQGG
jgi:hypothetical protein